MGTVLDKHLDSRTVYAVCVFAANLTNGFIQLTALSSAVWLRNGEHMLINTKSAEYRKQNALI